MGEIDCATQNEDPKTCSCHPDERPPACSREHAHTHCWLTYRSRQVVEFSEALIEIRSAASRLRGEQAYREFPRYVANRVKEALQVKGRPAHPSSPDHKNTELRNEA